MSLLKKVLAVTVLLGLTLGLGLSFVGDIGLDHHAAASTLKNTVKGNSTTTLTTTVDTAGQNIVKTARDIGVIALVCLLVWMGYSMWFKKSAEGLADMKGRLGAACLAIAFVFFTEKILGAIFGIFGYTL